MIADLLTEGSQSASLQFFLDSTYTTQVASKAFSINDTSTTPITYGISMPNIVSEGFNSFATLSTTGVPDQSIYWKIKAGTVDSEDFFLSQGSTVLNSGEAELSIFATADLLTEGIESAILEIYFDSAYTTPVVVKTFSIDDNSTTPISYSITAPSTVDEGAELLVTLNTTGIADQMIYWDISGVAGDLDLSRTGFAELVSGKLNVSIPVFADSATEGLEVSSINFYLENTFAPVASRAFSIQDTSLSPNAPLIALDSNSGRILTGGVGKDILIGGNGPDRLTGGASQDRKTGNLGPDTFAFLKISDSPKGISRRDIITDFNKLQGDRIDLSSIDANSRKGGNQSFRFVGKRALSGIAGELRYSSGILIGDVNGDKKSDFEIQLLGGVAIAKAQFVL